MKILKMTCALLAGASLLTGSALVSSAGEMGEGVSVTAKSSMTVSPDIAKITVGVRETGKSAKAGQEKVSEKLDAILAGLSDLDPELISVSGYRVSPEYDYSAENPSGGYEIAGYTVSVSVIISGQSVDRAGSLIASCVENGANVVSDVEYSVSDYDAIYEQVLSQAVKRAGEKATLMAKAAGASLGEVKSLSEGYENQAYAYKSANSYDMDFAEETMGVSSGSALALSPENLTISAEVTAVYGLVP